MKAKVEHGAKLIHVDPRFTRTSAMADIYAPIRAGSDIAFLGGLVNFVLNSERWNSDPFFRSCRYHLHQRGDHRLGGVPGYRELDGVFSGLMEYTGEPEGMAVQRLRRQVRERELAVRRHPGERRGLGRRHAALGRAADAASEGRAVEEARTARRARPGAAARPTTSWCRRSCRPPPERDETLQRSALRVPDRAAPFPPLYARRWSSRRPAARATPFLRVAQTILDNSGAGPHRVLRLRGGVDPAHQRRADHRLLRAAAAPAGQHGPAGRRHHGASRPCVDPGIDRHPDALPLDPRLHVASVGAEAPRHARRLARRGDAADRLLGQHAEVHGVVPEVDVRRRGDARRTTSATTGIPRSSATIRTWPMFVAMNEGRVKGMLLRRPEPGDLAEREARARGAAPAGLAGGQGQLAARDRHVLEERARGEVRAT